KMFVLFKEENLVEISLQSPENIQEVPGIVAYLYSLFAEHNLNILETMSFWTDTIFVIRENDLTQALNVIKKSTNPSS
ncbi:MAG: hypothetical protein Q7S92_03830, partial [Candidatus Diapherotrites archaeon]|nr:hypothetical protein [Candidatus Diapherotrites archaeon]